MHKCINNSIGNVYHLEQFVSDFFPYSQEQLGFDKPVTIRFESDQDNAGVMLGKTAYYDPEAMEVALYIDGRHPKDVMRSLSHELVHHAQNCRGDFTGQNNTGPGYAQEDPHLRKMEREAYTKGNLIFRDFEDLIKTGKKEVDIDFSKSGEPKMSLKEWKDGEINTRLMKKWGYLNESFASEQGAEASFFADEPGEWGTDAVEDQPELDFIFSAASPGQKEEFMLAAADILQAYDKAARANHPSAESLLNQVKQAWLKFSRTDGMEEGCGGVDYRAEDDEELEEVFGLGTSADEKRKKLANRPDFSAGGPQEDDPGVDPPTAWALQKAKADKLPKDTRTRTPRRRSSGGGSAAGSRNVFTMGENSGKISVKEAKEITRRIIERIKREGE